MAILDDLKKLADEDVLYLTRRFTVALEETSTTTVFRGRLRQALSGNWVFVTAIGSNGVVGIDLGQPNNNWGSAESPAGGPVITATFLGPAAGLEEVITLTPVIPNDFAD